MVTAIKDKLESAKRQLGFVEDSLSELIANPKDIKLRERAFATIIIFGRTVTFTLQNLKSIVGEKEFIAWYEPFQNEMKNDELLNAFKDARNNLEKQGQLQSKSGMFISSLNSGMLKKSKKTNRRMPKGFLWGMPLVARGGI